MPYTYILECADGSYYTGSTTDLERRLWQHQNGEGAKHTAKRLPVKLVYCEFYERISDAFYREKQIQGWSRKKKQALMAGDTNLLHQLAQCQNETHYFLRQLASGLASAALSQPGVDLEVGQGLASAALSQPGGGLDLDRGLASAALSQPGVVGALEMEVNGTVQVKVFYNRTGNTLTVWFGDPQEEVEVEETGDEVVLMKDKNGQVIGFEKLNFLPASSEPIRVAFETLAI